MVKTIVENEIVQIEKVWFENGKICIVTADGRHGSHPLEWFPRLQKATEKQRTSFELSPFGIHWPEIDEDFSFEGFFKYKPSSVIKKIPKSEVR